MWNVYHLNLNLELATVNISESVLLHVKKQVRDVSEKVPAQTQIFVENFNEKITMF